MIEHFTEAIILKQKNIGEFDKLIYLYAKELGKVVVKAKSSRKITSKLASQLEPLNIVKVRLIEKNGFQIADSMIFKKIEKSLKTIEIADFIEEMTFELQPDRKLWIEIKKSFENINKGNFSYNKLLEILGFSRDFAECANCQSRRVNFFSKKEQVFLCKRCGLKNRGNDLILINP